MAAYRLANILYDGEEVLAIEHQGALVSVSYLERRIGLESSPINFAEVDSFRRRVFSLGLAGLDDVLDFLGEGPAPPEAVLDSSQCLFLPPTLPNASLLEFSVRAEDPVPTFRHGNTRGIVGHESPLPIPTDEPAAIVSAQIAAVLGDDLRDATVEQAQRAVVGYAPLALWTFPSRERVSLGWGQYRLGQFGPFLCVYDDGFDPSALDVTITVNHEKVVVASARKWRTTFAEMIAFASEGVDLLAGDVIASGPLARTASDGARSLRSQDKVTVDIGSLGELTGVIVGSRPKRPSHPWAKAL